MEEISKVARQGLEAMIESGESSAQMSGMRLDSSRRLSTGIQQLDEILHGGFIPYRAYMIRGNPGSGKTTIGLHFLAEGLARGEATLYVTAGELEEEIRKNAAAIGISLEGVAFLNVNLNNEFLPDMEQYPFALGQQQDKISATQKIVQQIELLKPQRVFLDSMTQLRMLAPDILHLRRQVLAFLHFLYEQEATVLFTSEEAESASDYDLQTICDGVIHLHLSEYGRRLHISKFRGSDFSTGSHSLRLTDQGVQVFPHLLPSMYGKPFEPETISSGVPELDALLHGGLERGTITIITGPSGVGKTTLGLQLMKEAAGRGERSLVYLFDEWEALLIRRSEAVNIPIRSMMERGSLVLKQVEPLIFSPDEFAFMVRREVEQQPTSIVMIDSIAGYRLSVRGEEVELVSHLHALCKYLQNMGVAVLLMNEVEAITGEFRATEVGISYMADNLVFLRYLEMHGQMRKGIGVLKKRLTDFEHTMREMEITRYGIMIGKPLTELQRVLSGIPQWIKPSE